MPGSPSPGQSREQFLNPIRDSRRGGGMTAGPRVRHRREGQQVAKTRHNRAQGNSSGRSQGPPPPGQRDNPPGRQRGPQGQPSAREHSAAQRAARKRAEMRRRLLAPLAAVTAVLAIVGALVAVKLISAPPAQSSESLASSSIIKQVTTVPAAALTGATPGPAVTPLDAVGKPGPPPTVDGKPAIVFVSEESCPFCAAERWPLAVPP